MMRGWLGPRLLGIAAALFATCVSFGPRGLASLRTACADEASSRLRVVVRTVAPIDQALYERTAGQISDLPAELLRAEDTSLEPTMAGRLERARALASRFGAGLVVWFEHPSAQETLVLVALPEQGRVLSRAVRVPDDPMANATSAMIEASSLVVRTALVALEAGVTVGVPNEELTREAAPARVVRKPTAPTHPLPPAKSAPPRAPEWSPFVSLGWQMSIDGQSPAGARAGTLEVGVARGAWNVSMRGALGLPSRSHDELTSLEVSRHAASALLGRTLMVERDSSELELDVAAGGALVFFHREAFARAAPFSATPPADATSFAGIIEARGTWAPSVRVPLRLGLDLGADVLTSPLVFTYATSAAEIRRPSWFVQPRIAFRVTFEPGL